MQVTTRMFTLCEVEMKRDLTDGIFYYELEYAHFLVSNEKVTIDKVVKAGELVLSFKNYDAESDCVRYHATLPAWEKNIPTNFLVTELTHQETFR